MKLASRLAPLAVILLLAGPAVPDEEPFPLWPDRIKVRFRDRARPADAVRLAPRFPSEKLAARYEAETDGLTLALGPSQVVVFPPVDERAKLVRKDDWRLAYRERRPRPLGGEAARRELQSDALRRELLDRGRDHEGPRRGDFRRERGGRQLPVASSGSSPRRYSSTHGPRTRRA